MVVRGSACRAAIWTSRRSNPSVERRDEGVPEHVRVRSCHLYPGGFGELAQASRGGVAVHPGAAAVEQDRPVGTRADRLVDGPAGSGGQRNQDDLGSLAAHPQDPVAVLVAEAGDVRTGGFEDSQTKQPERRHEREVGGAAGRAPTLSLS
jgi:hypothetical protein